MNLDQIFNNQPAPQAQSSNQGGVPSVMSTDLDSIFKSGNTTNPNTEIGAIFNAPENQPGYDPVKDQNKSMAGRFVSYLKELVPKPVADVATGKTDLVGAFSPEASTKVNNFIDSIAKGTTTQWDAAYDDAVANLKRGQTGEVMKPGEALATGGHLAGDLARTILAPFASTFDKVTGGQVSAAIEKIGDKIADDPINREILNKLNDYFDQHPDLKQFALRDFPDILNLAGMMVGGEEAPVEDLAKDAKTSVGGAIDTVTDAANKGIEKITPDTQPILGTETAPVNNAKVVDLYNRAIRPSVTGRATAGQIADSNLRVVSGLKSIAENKGNLEFVNDLGDIEKGRTPQTVDELSQSISQTKSSIFKQYDAMAKAAGDEGGKVDFANSKSTNAAGQNTSIIDELNTIANNESLKIADPSAAKYATSLKNRLLYNGTDAAGNEVPRGPMSTSDVQDLIQVYNSKLKNFYRNPQPGMTSEAQIDAMMVNKLRAIQDATIEQSQGPGYQELKDKYGALSSMEKDVARRATVWGRQNKVGLAGTLSNVASGAEVVRGILTGNPVDIAVGGTIKAVEMYNKYINNPDVGIRRMFREIDRTPNSGGSSSDTTKSDQKMPVSPEPVKGETSPNDTTSSPESKTMKGQQGGYIDVGQIAEDISSGVSKVVQKLMHPGDITFLKNGINYFRGQGELSDGDFGRLSDMLGKMGISMDQQKGQIASAIESFLTGDKVPAWLRNKSNK